MSEKSTEEITICSKCENCVWNYRTKTYQCKVFTYVNVVTGSKYFKNCDRVNDGKCKYYNEETQSSNANKSLLIGSIIGLVTLIFIICAINYIITTK